LDWVKTNHVKRALREGRPTAGSWLHLCSGISAEIMSRAGFDWLMIDREHGPIDIGACQAMIVSADKDAFLSGLKARFESLRAEGTFPAWE